MFPAVIYRPVAAVMSVFKGALTLDKNMVSFGTQLSTYLHMCTV